MIMLIDEITSNPAKASTQELVAVMKDFGSKIKHFRRRFMVCLPEIKRRKCWHLFGFRALDTMAQHIADFSHGTVQRVINFEKKLHPFLAIRRLFEKTNIGWSKFELAARVIDEETADELYQLLKKDAPYAAIDTYVKDIQRKRKEAAAAAEAEAARAIEEARLAAEITEAPKSTEATAEKSDTKSKPSMAADEALIGDADASLNADADDSINIAAAAPLKIGINSSHMTSEKIMAQFASAQQAHQAQESRQQKTLFPVEGAQTSGKQPAIGRLVMQGGVQTVTLTLYPRTAERLMRKVDKLGGDFSRVKGVSKVIEHLLNCCDEDLVLDKDSNDLSLKKVKSKHRIDVVFWDKTRDSYCARTRYGTVPVTKEELIESGVNYENPIRLDDLYLKAKEKAAEYNAKVASAESPCRENLPAAVARFIYYDSGGGFCQEPGCNEPSCCSHHGVAWAYKPNCDPDTTKDECWGHHELNHLDLPSYSTDYGNEAAKEGKKWVDAKFQEHKKMARENKAREKRAQENQVGEKRDDTEQVNDGQDNDERSRESKKAS